MSKIHFIGIAGVCGGLRGSQNTALGSDGQGQTSFSSVFFYYFVRIFIFLFKFGCLFLCHLRSTWCEHACSPLTSSRASLRNAGFETELNELNEWNLAIEFIAKVRFRPEPGSRRRTATKPAQDEPIWEGSKLFKTLYNCFTIENDSAMPRFGRGVYALW